MKKTALLLLFFPLFGLAQKSMTQTEMKLKLDSILVESDLLYQYEKSALSAIKIIEQDKKISKKFGDVFVYKEGDTTKAIILSKDEKNSISELSFYKDYNLPKTRNFSTRNFSEMEIKLLSIKEKIIDEIGTKNYQVDCPDGFSLHKILIPSINGYKLYIITATNSSNLIPFGNDYLFNADNDGSIISWEKFHSRLILTKTKVPNGYKVVSSTHTHLVTVPFISATDICTFRIYGELCDQKDFSVISTALNRIFKYDLLKNEIEIEDMPK